MFNQGDQVICINAEDPNGLSKHFDQWVVKGEKYTVRHCGSPLGMPRLLLKEVKNPAVYIPEAMGKSEPGFSIERFRLAEEVVEVACEKEEELADV